MTDAKAYQATPHRTLLEQIMDSRVPKNEREHAAAREIERLRAALAAQPVEPDMRHPKIQALLGSRARYQIELRLVEQLVEDPNFETTSLDMEHWGPMHDKLKEKLTAPPAPAAVPLSDDQIERLREATFSINNPYCPVDSQSMRKAVRAAERAHGIVAGDKS